MATKKKSGRRKTRPRKKQPDRFLQVLLASIFLIGFLVASLTLLTLVQRPSLRSERPEDHGPEAKQSVADPGGQQRPLLKAVQLKLERALWRQGISFTEMDITRQGQVTHYSLPTVFPGKAWYEKLARDLEQESASLETRLDDTPDYRVEIFFSGKPLFLLSFRQPAKKAVAMRPKAFIAIIVDDLGRDLHALRDLLGIDLDLTVAVMPEEPHTRKTAEMAHRAGREVLVHMPMEPESYPYNNPGPGALLLGQDIEEIKGRVAAMFRKVPHAVGGNNHMGSRFTQYPEGMRAVLEVMKDGGWFFVDSRTSPRSIAYEEARRAGVPAATRDIFLDNNQDVDAIARQLRETVKLARAGRKVIAICHPYPATVRALQQEALFLRQQDVEVVPVSRLLRK
jgi:hypothetical protein